MGILDRFRARRPAPADLTVGFWVAEAVAMQRSIEAALAPWERADGPFPVDLSFEAGPDGRVLVVWRNRIVGFAPDAAAPALLDRLADGPAALGVRGELYRHGSVRRLWAGPRPASGLPPVPDPGLDHLPAPPVTVFGLRVDSLVEPTRDPVPPATTRPAGPVPPPVDPEGDPPA